jgi:hypothetical protein
MSAEKADPTKDDKAGGQGELAPDVEMADNVSAKGEDILALQDLDPALNMKMYLVNNVSISMGS